MFDKLIFELRDFDIKIVKSTKIGASDEDHFIMVFNSSIQELRENITLTVRLSDQGSHITVSL